MDSLSCPAGTGMWRIKMKIKKPSHIIKGGGFRVSKIMFHLRTQIQILSNQHGGIGRFFVLLVRIALVTVTDLGRGGGAGHPDDLSGLKAAVDDPAQRGAVLFHAGAASLPAPPDRQGHRALHL